MFKPSLVLVFKCDCSYNEILSFHVSFSQKFESMNANNWISKFKQQ